MAGALSIIEKLYVPSLTLFPGMARAAREEMMRIVPGLMALVSLTVYIVEGL